MMNKFLLMILLLLVGFYSYSQDKIEAPFIQRLSAGTSFNAVADEAVLGIHVDIEKDLWKWRSGVFYLGLGSYYGSFPNTNQQINEHIKGRTSLIQPLQLQTGHLLEMLNERFVVRISISAGPSAFLQKIKFEDESNDIHETYSYHNWIFTSQSKIGFGIRIKKQNHLEVYVNLPIINTNIAPTGIGLAFNRKLKQSTIE